MKKKKWLVGLTSLFMATLLLGACGKQETKDKTDTSDSKNTIESIAEEDINSVDLPQLNPEVADDEDLIEMVTTEGTMKIKLFPAIAPKAVENFLTHAKDGYYDGLTFHRVINNFMVQGGDPSGDGTGGESIWKESFEDEFSNKLYNLRGALSMANSGPDTNGSQFFIVQRQDDESDGLLKEDTPGDIIEAYKKGGTPHLDGKHTVFGQVIDGMDVLDSIASTKVGEGDKPEKDIKIEKINVLQEAK